jgi:hypothetical protein
MGLAKHHLLLTDARSNVMSTTKFGTWRYQAPEALTKERTQPRSRQEDMWAMGCILLEFIIWILYGNDGLQRFNEQITWDYGQLSPYYQLDNDAGASGAVLHDQVRHWISDKLPKNVEFQHVTAIRGLLGIAKDMLLVVNCRPRHRGGQSTASGVSGFRATAREFRDAMQTIRDKIARDRSYLFINGDDSSLRPVPPSVFLSTRSGQLATKDYSMPPVMTWQFPVDNSFALKVFDQLRLANPPAQLSTTGLCDYCTHLRFDQTGPIFERLIGTLNQQCGFCSLLRVLFDEQWHLEPHKPLEFSRKRDESCLRRPGSEFPALSILTSPGKRTQTCTPHDSIANRKAQHGRFKPAPPSRPSDAARSE